MSYKLFIADFDENESKVLSFESLEEVCDYMGGWKDSYSDYEDWFKELRDEGSYFGEWHHYHLIEV